MFYVAKKFMPSKYKRNEYYQMRATEDGTYTPSSTIPLKAEAVLGRGVQHSEVSLSSSCSAQLVISVN